MPRAGHLIFILERSGSNGSFGCFGCFESFGCFGIKGSGIGPRVADQAPVGTFIGIYQSAYDERAS